MKIVHFSDTHLGHIGQSIQNQVEDPFHPGTQLAQHAVDILVAFRQAVDLIVDQVRPDVVIHSGDLFDSARPQMSVLDVAMQQFRRILEADIPLLIIEGNQSYPRDRSMGHALQLLKYLPGLRVVCDDYEVVRFPGLPLAIHALPHAALANNVVPNSGRIVADEANMLVVHGVADSVPFYTRARTAPSIFLAPCEGWFDYIALGHYHHFCQANLRRRAFYSGATAMITWEDFDPSRPFGLNVVEPTGNDPIVKTVSIPGRSMHAYGLDDASGYSAQEILTMLGRQVEISPADGAYCWAHIGAIEPLARKDLDAREIEAMFAPAAGLKLALEIGDLPLARTQNAQREGGTPTERFDQLSLNGDGDESFRDEVRSLGQRLLDMAADAVAEESD